MTALLQLYCLYHKNKKAEYFVYSKNKGFGFCKDCWELATKIHQLVLPKI